MIRILIGIPRGPGRNTSLFDESLSRFISEAEKYYSMEVCERHGNRVDEVREVIVEEFLNTDNDYLLFLDDDHTGHTLAMLDALLKPDTKICAIKCYSRYFPHFCTLMDRSKQRKNGFDQALHRSGYHACEFVGFGMTLIKREVFAMIDKPYFQATENNDREDTYFCAKLEEKGVIPIGCFDYTLTHDGVNEETVDRLRRINGIKWITKRRKEQILKAYKEGRQREEEKCLKK